jgi:hypothetical protein
MQPVSFKHHRFPPDVTRQAYLQLVAKSHHLELKVDASPEAGQKAVNDGNDDLACDADVTGHHLEKSGFLRRTQFMGGTELVRRICSILPLTLRNNR